jgi:hypothetical protein
MSTLSVEASAEKGKTEKHSQYHPRDLRLLPIEACFAVGFDYRKLLIRFMLLINASMLHHTDCDDSVLPDMGQSTLLAKMRCMGRLSVAQARKFAPNGLHAVAWGFGF